MSESCVTECCSPPTQSGHIPDCVISSPKKTATALVPSSPWSDPIPRVLHLLPEEFLTMTVRRDGY